MHTVIVVAGGLALLLATVVLGRWIGGPGVTATVAKYFIPVWLAIALSNLWVGVSHAGYTVAQELPILVVVFAVPAAVAVVVWWKFSRG